MAQEKALIEEVSSPLRHAPPQAVARLLALVLVLLSGCVSQPSLPPEAEVIASDYIRLYSKGSWGTDTEIVIYPDDIFRRHDLHSNTHRIIKRRSGRRDGLFLAVIRVVEARRAWSLTSESMRRETEAAQKEDGAVGVMDANHEFLEIRFRGKGLKVDYNAPCAFAESFPRIRSLKAYCQIIETIHKQTVGP